MKPIRVLITDDSGLARAMLRHFLEQENGIEVIGEACNGREAVEFTRKFRPDLVTMDLDMPVMNGIDAIEEIMWSRAVPILVVSAVADARKALEAVGRGALEVVPKPDCSPEQAAEFVDKVRLLAGVTVITRMRPRRTAPDGGTTTAAVAAVGAVPTPVWPQPLPGWPVAAASYNRVFAIACSTGGPQALALLLAALPAGFPAPVLIAQHIADGFAAGMVQWLGSLCKLPVRLAADGDLLQAGVIHISPSERHFSITPTRRVTLVERRPNDLYHPNCDVLLSAAAEVFASQAVGIILTGMSSDGVKGITRIHDRGGTTIAQDQASSVIFGMNRVAIEAGVVQQVLPVASIAPAMVRLAGAPARQLGGMP